MQRSGPGFDLGGHGDDRWRKPQQAPQLRPDQLPPALAPDDTAARFFEKLRLLARFGLASHSRLLLDDHREDD